MRGQANTRRTGQVNQLAGQFGLGVQQRSQVLTHCFLLLGK